MPNPPAGPSSDAAGAPAPTRSPERAKRMEQARAYSIEAARLCADSHCRSVKVLDVSHLSPVCDYFVLATAASARQMRSVAIRVEELGEGFDLRPMTSVRRGEANERWFVIDLVDVMVHLFNDEARLFYDLDNLWGDAKEVPWARPDEKAAE